MDLLHLINLNDHYSKLEKNIIDFILNNQESVVKMDIKELAKKTYSSTASISRLCQKLGFSGFKEFKFYLKNRTKSHHELSEPKSSWINLNQEIIETLDYLDEIDISKILKAFECQRNIFVYGTGWGEKNAAQLLSRNFLSINKYIINIPSITELKWLLSSFSNEDFLIIISFSGENQELISNLKYHLHQNFQLLSITRNQPNDLLNLSNYNLTYPASLIQNQFNTENNEYNFYVPLSIIIDKIFRTYLDTYYL